MTEAEKIGVDMMVTIDYTLTDDAGKVIDTSEGAEPLSYIHGHSQVIPGLEKAIEGKSEGDEESFKVDEADGYGAYEPERVMEVPRSKFDFDVKEDMVLQAQRADGQVMPVRVLNVDDDKVTLDGNHPLAGQNLNFKVSVRGVRSATADEIDALKRHACQACGQHGTCGEAHD